MRKKAELQDEIERLREEVANLREAVDHQEHLMDDYKRTIVGLKRERDTAYESGGLEVFPGADGQFYWHYRAGNGEVIAHSEGYTRKADAERGGHEAIATIGTRSEPDDAREASAQPEDEGE